MMQRGPSQGDIDRANKNIARKQALIAEEEKKKKNKVTQMPHEVKKPEDTFQEVDPDKAFERWQQEEERKRIEKTRDVSDVGGTSMPPDVKTLEEQSQEDRMKQFAEGVNRVPGPRYNLDGSGTFDPNKSTGTWADWLDDPTYMGGVIPKDESEAILAEEREEKAAAEEEAAVEEEAERVGNLTTYEQEYIDKLVGNVRDRQGVTLGSEAERIARGEMPDAIKHQAERARQSVLSTAAGARGVPAAAAHRMKVQGMSEVDRSAMEATGKMQLDAMQLVDEMTRADAEINAKLESQRDSMVQALIASGVERDVAVMKVQAALEEQRRDLSYKYWAGRLGASVEIIQAAIESAGMLESEQKSVSSLAHVLNTVGGFEVPGYVKGLVPDQRVVSSEEGELGRIKVTTENPAPPGYVFNEETKRWELTPSGTPPEPEVVAYENMEGFPMVITKVWDADDGEWVYYFSPDPAYADYAKDWEQDDAEGAAEELQDPYDKDAPIPLTPAQEGRMPLSEGDGGRIYPYGQSPGSTTPHSDNAWEEYLIELEAAGDDEYARHQARVRYQDKVLGGGSDEAAKEKIEEVGLGARTHNQLGVIDSSKPWGDDKHNTLLGGIGPGPIYDQSSRDPAPYRQGTAEAKLGEITKAKGLLPPRPVMSKPTIGDRSALPPSGDDWRDTAITGLRATGEVLGGLSAAVPLLASRGQKEREAALLKFGSYGLGKVIQGGMNLLDSSDNELEKATKASTKELIEIASRGTNSPEVLSQASELADEGVKAVLGAGATDATMAITDAATTAKDAATAAADTVADTGIGTSGASAVTGIAKGIKDNKPDEIIESVTEGAGEVAGYALGGPPGAAIGKFGGKAIGNFVSRALGAGGTDLSGYDPSAPFKLDMRDSRPLRLGGEDEFKLDPLMKEPNWSGFETKTNIEGLHVPDSFSYDASPKSPWEDEFKLKQPGLLKYNPSDEEAKTDVGPSQDELSHFLRELNPVKYDYKPEFGGEKDQYGIIAQDAEKTGPGKTFVKKDANGIRRIDPGKATMVGLAADANQQKLIDSQSMLLASLLKRLDRIEGKAS